MNQTTTRQPLTARLLFTLFLLAVLVVMAVDPAFAGAGGGGFQKATDTVDKLVTFLTGIGIATVTVAIMWAGYKVLFMKNTLSDVANILIGGTLIGGAAGAAAWIMS